jgi:hypothetical protein
LTNCDGTTESLLTLKRCSIPFDTLRTSPFELPWGSSIYVKVAATNIMGVSVTSQAGNGAMITRVPDAPVNLVVDSSISNAVNIGILWDNGVESGGLPVLDYRVWYD